MLSGKHNTIGKGNINLPYRHYWEYSHSTMRAKQTVHMDRPALKYFRHPR